MTEWTDQEDALIRELYPQMPAKFLARRLGRDHGEIHRRAFHLRVKRCQQWTRAEDMAIRLMYFRGAKAVSGLITGRTIGAIWARAWRLGLSKPHEEWIDD